MSNRKSITLFNVTDVEIELAVEIEPAVLIEPAVEIELFPFYTAGSINTASTAVTLRRLIFHSILDFHSKLNFHSKHNFQSVTLKSVILFLLNFNKSSFLSKKDSDFCLVYGIVYKKISISILFHVRGNGNFPGLNFHITDVESEPAVLKEIPPLHRLFFKRKTNCHC